MMHKEKAQPFGAGSGAMPPFYRMKKGMEKAGRIAARAIFAGALTWAALTSTASTAQAQENEYAKRIVIDHKGNYLCCPETKAKELSGDKFRILSGQKWFYVDLSTELKEIGPVDSVRNEKDWTAIFGKHGILHILFWTRESEEAYVASKYPLIASYCDRKNRFSVAVDNEALMIIHPLYSLSFKLRAIVLTYKQIFEAFGVEMPSTLEVPSTSKITLGPDPENENRTIVSFDGTPTLRIFNNSRNPEKDVLLEYIISDKTNSGD